MKLLSWVKMELQALLIKIKLILEIMVKMVTKKTKIWVQQRLASSYLTNSLLNLLKMHTLSPQSSNSNSR